MDVLEQIFLMPFAFLWVPGLIFAVLVGGAYWWSRPAPAHLVAETDGRVQLKSATAGTETTKEQRNMFRRQGNPVEVFVAFSDDKKKSDTGSVLDRSMGGMRLAVFNELSEGTLLSVRPVNADEIVPWVELEVRSCRASVEMPGQFELGCQYVKSPPYSIQLLFG